MLMHYFPGLRLQDIPTMPHDLYLRCKTHIEVWERQRRR